MAYHSYLCTTCGQRVDTNGYCKTCGGTWWFMSQKTRCALCRKHKTHTHFIVRDFNENRWVCKMCMNKWFAMATHLFDK